MILSIILLVVGASPAPRQQLDVIGYDTFMRGAFAEVHRQLAADLAQDLQPEERILEIAFGAPYLSIEVAEVTLCRIDVVVEGSLEMLVAIRRIEDAGLSGRIGLHMASVESLPFPDETFDLVLARDAMRFWHNEPKAFSEINRVLKDRGVAHLGSGLQQIMTLEEADVFWEYVQGWRNTTDHRPWAATLPFPEMITAALDSAGIDGYRVWNEGYCTCRTSARWQKGAVLDEEAPPVTYDQPPPIGDKAPDFTLVDAVGDSVSLSELDGYVRVVDFWAIGCRSCFWLMKRLSPVHHRLADQGVRFLAINLDSSKERAQQAATRAGLDLHMFYGGSGVAQQYGVRGLPHVVILDGTGRIRARFLGGTEDVALRIEQVLESFLSENQ